MTGNKLWSALTHYNNLIIKYQRKQTGLVTIRDTQRISNSMQWHLMVSHHKNDPDVQHVTSIELHRIQKYDGPHTWYDYKVLVNQCDFIPDVHKTEWKTLEEIIIGGDE